MTYQSKARAFAKKHGVILHNECDANNYEYRAETPPGYIWNEGVHEFVGHCFKGDPEWYEGVWKDLYERMEGGMDLCTDKDCEWCNNTREMANG